MLPIYEKLNSSTQPSARIPFGKFSVYVVLLPLLSFLFCVIWCVIFYFERSTSTHCGVSNYLPSISAAIGNYQPQRFIWQLAICIDFIPRLVITKVYLDFYREVIRKDRMHLAKIASSLNIVENVALLVLTLWTSSEHYDIHKFAFGTFIFTSQIYMVVAYFLNKNGRRLPLATKEELRSIRFKKALLIVNVMSFCLAGLCFMRHNSLCEPGGEFLESVWFVIHELSFQFIHSSLCLSTLWCSQIWVTI